MKTKSIPLFHLTFFYPMSLITSCPWTSYSVLEETNQKVMFKVFPRYASSLHFLLHFEAPKIQQPSWLVNLSPLRYPPLQKLRLYDQGLWKLIGETPQKPAIKPRLLTHFTHHPSPAHTVGLALVCQLVSPTLVHDATAFASVRFWLTWPGKRSFGNDDP